MEPFNVANMSLIKDMNSSAILHIVRSRGPISRADISKLTKLNPATVSNNVADLIELGIVREVGIGVSSGGRKPMLIELHPGAFYVVGVDMGTTNVSAGVADLEGAILHNVTLPFEERKSPEEIIRVMELAVQKVMEVSEVNPDRFLGIGMGIHGLVDPETGTSLYAPAFQWENVEIAEYFRRAFSLPVLIDNDARVMALGEKWFGKAVHVNNFVFLNIGTGVGSGIYVNGELIRGAHFGAGEIGHIRTSDEGRTCFCGKKGCLSTVASGPVLEHKAREAIANGTKTVLTVLSEGLPEAITGEMIHAAALQGDELAVTLLRDTGRHVGAALSLVVNLLDPEMVLIGGGVSNAGDFLFDGVKEEIMGRAMKNNTANLYIGPAGLGDDCGIVGAATLILRNMFSNPNQYKENS